MGDFSLDTHILFSFELYESLSTQKVKLQIHLLRRRVHKVSTKETPSTIKKAPGNV